MRARMRPRCRQQIRLSSFRPACAQLLKPTASQFCEWAAGRIRSLPVKIDRHAELVDDAAADPMRDSASLLECETHEGDEWEHIERADAWVHTIMSPQIDVLKRHACARDRRVFDHIGRAHCRDHAAMMIFIRRPIEYRGTRSFKRGHDGTHDT